MLDPRSAVQLPPVRPSALGITQLSQRLFLPSQAPPPSCLLLAGYRGISISGCLVFPLQSVLLLRQRELERGFAKRNQLTCGDHERRVTRQRLKAIHPPVGQGTGQLSPTPLLNSYTSREVEHCSHSLWKLSCPCFSSHTSGKCSSGIYCWDFSVCLFLCVTVSGHLLRDNFFFQAGQIPG